MSTPDPIPPLIPAPVPLPQSSADVIHTLLLRQAYLEKLLADYAKWPPNPVWRAQNELDHVNQQLAQYGYTLPPGPPFQPTPPHMVTGPQAAAKSYSGDPTPPH